MTTINRVLVVGVTGRTGRHVVAQAAAYGLTPVALARSEAHALEALPPGTEIVTGDPDAPGALDAVEDTANLPVDAEPARVRDDLAHLRIP
ncbi:NAD(P)H-binding protein [Streptomyces krungchingensis]